MSEHDDDQTVRVRMDDIRPEHCRRGCPLATVINQSLFVCLCGPEMQFTPIKASA